MSDGYFITEVINSLLNEKVLVTNDTNIVRDYVHPDDLFSAIRKCIIESGKINAAFDVASAKPVTKREILDYFSSQYDLKYEMNQSLGYDSATGAKNIYCSNYNKAQEIGYQPKFSSLETIKEEAEYILGDSDLND